MSVITTVGQWRGVVLYSLSRRRSPGLGYGMSSASVDAVADSGGSRMTNVARTVAIFVGGFANWKVYCI